MDNPVGVTEGADPTVNKNWVPWVKSGKPAILITKRPDLLVLMVEPKDNIIIHCTITGLGSSVIEPGIPPLQDSLPYYHLLVKAFGKDRVVLRIDPIIPNLEPLASLKSLAKEAEGRVRVSFMDLYPHVRERLSKEGIALGWSTFHAPLEERLAIWKYLGKPEVCAEPGLPNTPCVSELDCKILGVKPNSYLRGQRKECGCLANKIEICKRPPKCTYGCLYCYWK